MLRITGTVTPRASLAQTCGGLALLVLAVAACSDRVPPIAPVHAPAANAALPAAARYIVELASAGATPAPLAARIAAGGGHILHTHRGMGLMLVSGLSADAATALQHEADVRAVVPDFTMRMVHEPAMRRWTGMPRQTGAHGVTTRTSTPDSAQFLSHQWNIHQIRADSAWHISSQGSGVKVFILDTGIDTAHDELKGLVDVALSTSFAFADTDSLLLHPLPFSHDVVGHGTFVSSIVASNSVKIAAVAPQATIVMVRVLGDSGQGTAFALLNGILYAADNGADIINMSLGGYIARDVGSFLSFADLYQRVADYAAQHGVVLIAAAGNESVNTNTATAPTGSYIDSLNTPAGLHHVLSVGATGPVDQANFDQIAMYSNFGDAGVGVFAPGGNTVDTTAAGADDLVLGACSSSMPLCPGVENAYLIGAGTSFASPHAAGEAAVVKAQHAGAISGQSLEICLLNSADNLTGHRPDPNYNFGRIDVVSALNNKGCKSGS